jgi:hypothetical protein
MKTRSTSRSAAVPFFTMLALASACTDGPLSPERRRGPAQVVVEYECVVEVTAGTSDCQRVSIGQRSIGPRLDLSLGTTAVIFRAQWTHSRGSTADEDTSTNIMRFINNIGQPLGTTDGSTPHANGNRLFFTAGPTVTQVSSGTLASASIRLDTPDGMATIADEFGISLFDRPYYQYNGILTPGDTSTAREIRLIYSPNVKAFYYRYRVSAPVQYDVGWITISLIGTPVMEPGGTTTLAGMVYDQFGALQADGITWSSSNAAVATVNSSTGEVTAVGEGMATITATSSVNTQRTGTRTIVVDEAPTVVSTTPADSATPVASNSNIVITFSEPVIVYTNSFLLECPVSYDEPRSLTVSGSGTSTITIDPDEDLPEQTMCTVTVQASVVSDADGNDGPDVMALDYVFSFEVGITIHP